MLAWSSVCGEGCRMFASRRAKIGIILTGCALVSIVWCLACVGGLLFLGQKFIAEQDAWQATTVAEDDAPPVTPVNGTPTVGLRIGQLAPELRLPDNHGN